MDRGQLSVLNDCLVLNLRRASRAATREYDKVVRGKGISATQFSLVAAVGRREEQSVSDVADYLAMDRTTASRNLAVLERRGLVESRSGISGNVRLCRLTREGEALLVALLPHWQAARDASRDLIGHEEFDQIVATLKTISGS